MPVMNSIVFTVSGDGAAGYTAVAEDETYGLVTEAADLDELKLMVEDLVNAFFGQDDAPDVVWRFTRDEAA